ncbi:MAG: YoaP domain-containing protein [Spirochaetales bacterium]|nr:YoaP domain-containing protein [Spirochaetales bacterium]
MARIVTLDTSNIAGEHICCAIADKKCQHGVEAKKALLRSQYGAGYRFKKLDVRGKVFIEYVPADASWLPIEAAGYMLINCFWVSGQYKGQGWGRALLAECERDAAAMSGIVAVASQKKRPFMADAGFLKRHGFEPVDEAEPYFTLWCKTFCKDAPRPRFLDSARTGTCENTDGLVVYYSDYCPFTGFWNNTVLPTIARERDIPLTLVKIDSQEAGRRTPVPWIINSVFLNGRFLTQEIKIDKILDKERSR